MKINATSPIGAIERYKSISRNVATISENKVEQKDRMEISSDAALFSDTLKAARNALNERLEKPSSQFEKVKAEIEDGSYQIKANGLAKSILMASDQKEDEV